MSIQQYIQEQVLAPRLTEHQVLVVYDPERRYRELCRDMASDKRLLIDATESSIDSRLAALNSLRRLGANEIEQLLVYVPAPAPLHDEDKQRDPFALYGACGAVFPDGDGDAFASLCLKAKPDHGKQVRAVFAKDANPSFAVIDAIGGGLNWPNLRALLKVESVHQILMALLLPDDAQQAALRGNDAWTAEARELIRTTVGLSLKTRGKGWSAIADELWRYLLFSEFVFDLPEALPAALCDVPHADDDARLLVEKLCDNLRSDRRSRSAYIERAETIETELGLRDICGAMADLGERDTFPFEERTFLQQAIEALAAGDTDRVQGILVRHEDSVWTGKGESRAQWDLLGAALDLIKTCDDHDRLLADHTASLDSLMAFYATQLREVDRLHREFEQAVSDYIWQDPQGVMGPVQQQARKRYAKLLERVQRIFTRHLAQVGWPLAGWLSNTEVFDTLVAPKLQHSGNKVAYMMIDALRYELGVALERQLADDGSVEIKPALAQLPSVTTVGMAALLPEASSGLRLVKTEQGVTPFIGEQAVGSVPQRMGWLTKRYGQRFQEGRLEDFVRNRLKINDGVELLVLRAVEIDSQFENHPDTAPAELTGALKRIRVAVHRLKDAGFNEVVIVTDHGFFMNTHAGAGDTCAKPPGDWLNVHDRCLLGQGSADGNHYLLGADKAGIRGDFPCLAGPLSLAAYRDGLLYYHGGASLQECVVPVICLQLRSAEQPAVEKATVTLNYKNGAKRITTRLPVVEVAVHGDLLSNQSDFEILLEAHDKKGEVVGEAKLGGRVDPSSGTITLRSTETIQVALKMHLEFEGKFKVKALNPTTLTAYAQLDLETDYAV